MKRYEDKKVFYWTIMMICITFIWYIFFVSLTKIITTEEKPCQPSQEIQQIQSQLSGLSEQVELYLWNTKLWTVLYEVELEEETTKAEICVWITDITVATYQAKDLFECIWNWEWYCNCIEKYASCDLQLSDIPKEYQNDFNPDCFHN